MRGTIWSYPEAMTGLDWAKLKAIGLPNKGTKFPRLEFGWFNAEGWELHLHEGKSGRKHRLFVVCDCEKEVEAGHYGQHYKVCNAAQKVDQDAALAREAAERKGWGEIADWLKKGE